MGSRLTAAGVICALTSVAWGHDLPDPANQGQAGKLAFILPNLYGGSGLVLPNQTHMAHFDSAFRDSFGPFNASLASQLTSLPIPSPASGFTYSFDKELGVATRSAQSFGPILTERAETIGKDKFYFGIAQQFFRFDSIDGISLRKVPVVFQHAPAANPEFAKDIISTSNFLDIRIGQVTPYFTYGVTDRLDVSVAVPLMSATLTADSKATIQRIGTGTDQSIHFFTSPDLTTANFSGSGHRYGLGDIVVRAKGTVLRASRLGLAMGVDVRAPTGDEYDFLGTGAPGVKPFMAASFRAGNFAPHANVGFQWNGNSVLAGNVAAAEKAKLPNEISYAIGADVGINKRFTLAADMLGLTRPNAQRVVLSTFSAANSTLFSNIAFHRAGLSQRNAAIGFKINGMGNLILAFNVLLRLDDAGLKSRVTPLISASYMF